MNIAKLMERASTFEKSTLTIRSGAVVTTKSFRELVADVRALQERLREIGVTVGHVVGIQAEGKYEFIVWDLALIGLGAIPHVFPEDWPISEMRARAQKAGIAFIVSGQAGTLVLPSEADPDFLRDAIRVSPSAVRAEDRDLLTHVYSSGTTGTYKGLVISRSGAEALAKEFIDAFSIDSDDRYLFFLPLSHFQQRLGLYTCLESGTSFMYTPHTHVFHDIRTFRPTFLIGPPVFYETALATLVSRGANAAAGSLMAGLGGNVRFLITGMAPIRRNVLEAYGQHGVRLLEAYGITEVGLVAWNTPDDNRVGTVGRPLSHHHVALTDDSEILVRADSPLSKGYFDVPEEEGARTFLTDGYIATGDIGELQGARLVLKGRKKDIIVTGAGAKFHPLELEQRILSCTVVRQAVVINDWEQGGVVAVISVDDPHDEQTIALVDRLAEDINDSVPSYKRIGRTVVTRTRFTQDNGMLTRNLKPNRAVIARHFAKQAPLSLAMVAS